MNNSAMRVFVDADILKWLSNLLHLDSSKFNFALTDTGKCEIRDEDLIDDISLGLVASEVLKVIKELNRGMLGDSTSKDTSHKLELLKKIKSSGAKSYNWNILFEQLQSMIDIKVEKETRDLILSDDKQVATDLLIMIYTKCRIRGLKMSYLNTGPLAHPPPKREAKKAHSTAIEKVVKNGREDSKSALNRLNQSIQSETKVPQNQGHFSNDLGNPQELNLETFDPFIEYSQAQNCLGFVLLAICKNIQVNALQAASLLANGNKYLSQLIIRGKKNHIQPVIAMLSDVYRHMPTLVKLIEQEESQGSVKFVLQAFKAIFHSANIEVAKYGSRIYSKVLYDLANRDYLPDAWEWFGSLYGGFFAVYACFDHWKDEVIEPLCSVLTQAGRFSTVEMFTVELRKVMPIAYDYVNFVSHIIEPMSKSKLIKDDIQNAGVFEFLFEISMKSEEPENAKNLDFRVAALNLLMQLWILYPYKFEVDATLGNAVVSLMKRSARLPGISHKISIYTFLVTLLNQFAADRNPYAPVVYKILVFSLIENYKDSPIREFLSLNIKKILTKIPTLPVATLVDPVTKQLDLYEDDLGITMHDIDLIRAIVSHPRLTAQSALLMFNSLSKLLLNSRPYQQCLSTILIGLLRRHIEDATFCEYAVKFISVTLVAVFKSFKQGGAQRLDMERRLDNVHRFDSPTMANTEIEKELRDKNWRAVMINTIRDIIMLRQSMVNEQLENRLLFTNREVFKLLSYNYKGIVTLLNILRPGVDALTTIEEYEKEMKAVEEVKAVNAETHNKRATSPHTKEEETNMYRRELHGDRVSESGDDRIATHPDQLRPVKGRRGGSRRRTFADDRNSLSSKGPMKSQYGSIYKGLKMTDDLDDLDAISQDDLEDLNEKFGGKLGLKSHTRMGAKGEKTDKKYQSGNIKVWKKDGADPRLRKHLEDLKQKQELAKLKQAERELSKKAKEDKINKNLEEELNWRKKGHPSKEKEMFLDLNMGEMYLGDMRAQSMDQHILIDPVGGSEETLEREYTNMLLLKHKSALQYLFKKYANLIPDKSKATFDLMGKRASSLSLPEVTKLLSDYFITEFVDKVEITTLVKMINEADGNLKNLKFLDYDGYIKFMVNLATIIHAREPIDMPELSHALMFESLLDMFDKGRRMRREQFPNFGPQNSAKYVQEKDMIELMNFRLEENPEFVLPPNFRKVREKKVNLDFRLPVSLMVPQSYTDCYEIVADLIKDIFEVNMIEPQAKFFWTVEAQPREDLFETDFKAIKEYKEKQRKDRNGNRVGPVVNLIKPEAREVMPKTRDDEEDRARLQEKILRGPASFQVKSKDEYLRNLDEPKKHANTESALGKQGATGSPVRNQTGPTKNNLKQIPEASKRSIERHDSRTPISGDKNARGGNEQRKPSNAPSLSNKESVSGPSLTQNSGQLSQAGAKPLRMKSNDSATMIGQVPRNKPPEEPKRDTSKPTSRQLQLEADLRRMKVLSDLDAKNKKPASSPSPDQVRQKELAEEVRRQKIKDEVKAYKEKLDREKRDRLDRERQQKEVEDQMRRERSRAAMRDRKKELEGFFKEEEVKLREKSKEARKRQDEEKAFGDRVKKEAEAAFKNEREKMQRENYYNEKIQQILNSGSLKPILANFDPQLKVVFKHYIDSIADETLETNLQDSTDILHFRNFMAFASQFNIVPALLNIPEIKVMYRSCTKHKNLSDDRPIGLDFKAFTEMLLRISLKKPDFFRGMKPGGQDANINLQRGSSAKGKGGQKAEEESNVDLDSDQMKDFSGLRMIEDNYTAVDTFEPESFEGLCVFLDMPATKNKLTTKLNSLRRENVRTKSRMELVKSLRRKYGIGKEGGSRSPRERSGSAKVDEKSAKTLNKKLDDKEKPKEVKESKKEAETKTKKNDDQKNKPKKSKSRSEESEKKSQNESGEEEVEEESEV